MPDQPDHHQPDQPDHHPDSQPDRQNLNLLANGTHAFDATAQNRPPLDTGGGIVLMLSDGDKKWQLATGDHETGILHMRSWHHDNARWQDWEQIGGDDGAPVSTAIADSMAAITAALEATVEADANARTHDHAAAIRMALDNAIADEVADRNKAIDDAIDAAIMSETGTRDVAITSAVSAAISDAERRIHQTVQDNIRSAIDVAIDDEETDRNGAIAVAVSAESTARSNALQSAIAAQNAARSSDIAGVTQQIGGTFEGVTAGLADAVATIKTLQRTSVTGAFLEQTLSRLKAAIDSERTSAMAAVVASEVPRRAIARRAERHRPGARIDAYGRRAGEIFVVGRRIMVCIHRLRY